VAAITAILRLSPQDDQENRIATATKSGVTTTYTYDDDGNRVEKSSGGSGTLYWYMSPGIVAESDLLGNLQSEYVFFDGERVARKDFPGLAVSYYFSDHLKTASVITDSVGNVKSESDYYPWGGELQFVNNDSNHYKFTGKERDSETGLDYFGARYYSNGLGRFITPDWAAKATAVPYAEFADPQSLNLYTYVRNIPTTRYDADGHDVIPIWNVVLPIIQYMAAHVGVTGNGMNATRQEYVQKAQALKAAGGTTEQRTQLAEQYREKGPVLGQQIAKQEAADPARLAARAAKTDSQLAESVGRTSSRVTGLAKTAGVAGKIGTGVAVGIGIYHVASAPDGQKVSTASKEGMGLSGAIAGGELGAEAGAFAGPWGAAGGGLIGAIGGGMLGKGAMETILSNPNRTPNSDNEGCSHGSGSSCR
jgi:RHS repeat-associated protein